MSLDTQTIRALRWDGRRLTVLDQTRLPGDEVWLELTDAADTAAAIRRLAVRGAPLIGVAAAFGLAMQIAARPDLDVLDRAAEELRSARPTAVNLARAVERVRTAALAAGPTGMGAAAQAEAQRIQDEEEAASAVIASGPAGSSTPDDASTPAGSTAAGESSTPGASSGIRPLTVLTHCNTGGLAAGGHGSALAIVLALAERGPVKVLACESRPLLQGARLTVWELARQGVAHELVVDAAAAGLIRRGEVDAVVVGCDRVAANGDVANKVGTYAHALAAQAAGIPFVVAGPTSSIDLATPHGDAIVIEDRDGDEVRRTPGGELLTLPGTPVRNPAFDVTPAQLVSALVTERGVAAPPSGAAIAELLEPDR